ncbi:MAG: hypothetical protein H6707_01785 [Deltaproteobacteria bacterium]|nr:hypothetical protein [Deltaproteobacteria bacterium]
MLHLSALAFIGQGLLAVAHALTSYLIAARLCPTVGTSLRLAAAALVGHWTVSVTLYCTGTLGAFNAPTVVGLWVALSAWQLSRLRRDTQQLALARADITAIKTFVSKTWQCRWSRWPLALFASVATLYALRGIVAPPYSWDALTYHLPRAVEWIQSGSLAPHLAPYAWRAYEFYPIGGDALWAFAMLVERGTVFLAIYNIAVWLGCLLGVYALARQLGATMRAARAAALLLGATPTVLALIYASHVNNQGLALFCCAAALLTHLLRDAQARPSSALVACGGFATAAGTQLSFVPTLLLAGIAILGWTLPRPGRRLRVIGGCLAIALLPLASYARTWLYTGSLLYPFGLAKNAAPIFAGEPLHMRLHAGEFLPEQLRSLRPWQLIEQLFWAPSGDYGHLGLGPACFALLGLGTIAALGSLRSGGRTRLTVLVLLALASTFIWGFFSEGREAIRTVWASTAGRFILPVFAVLAALVAASRWRHSAIVLSLAAMLQLGFCYPRGLNALNMTAIALTLLALAAAAALLHLGWRRPTTLGRSGAFALATAVLASSLPWLLDRYRIPIYRQVARERMSSARGIAALHILPSTLTTHAWPIWRYLDQRKSLRVALVAGWEGLGLNWFRYPLYGSRLQNRVSYLPPTRDGSVIDYAYRERLQRALDRRAWIARLVEQRIDAIVSLDPPAPEDQWMRSMGRLFLPVAIGQDRIGRCYRFAPQNARAWLRTTRDHQGAGLRAQRDLSDRSVRPSAP